MGWTLDKPRKVWITSDYSDLDMDATNNLAEYAEPYDPYDNPTDYIDDFPFDFKNVVVEMTQQQVMTNGYGRAVTAKQFPIVARFLDVSADIKVPFGTFTFDDLLKMKFAMSSSERWIHTNLYGSWGPFSIFAGDFDPDDAYVHGSVSFALKASTRFINSPSVRRVSAEIGAGDDNWDFESSNVSAGVENTVAKLLGPLHYNLEAPIKIRFTGPGKIDVVEARVAAKLPAAVPGPYQELRNRHFH